MEVSTAMTPSQPAAWADSPIKLTIGAVLLGILTAMCWAWL
jgi:hypothetical protein